MRNLILSLLLIGLILVGCTQQSVSGNETNKTNFTGTNQSNNTTVQNCSGPVCGSDGKTYSTDCVAAIANASVRYSGECQVLVNCTDSDSGLKIDTAGTVIKGNDSYSDYCLDSNQLVEYTCLDGTVQMATINCGSNKECKNSICAAKELPQENITSNVSAVGCNGPVAADIYAKESATFNGNRYNDSCVDYRVVKDYFCLNNKLQSINNQCPSGHNCNNGKCVPLQQSCEDSDNGENVSVRGHIIVLRGLMTSFEDYDSCIDEGMLREYICVNNDSVAKNITCKSGTRCASGRCIKSACSDTDDGIDFTIEGTASANSVEMTDECINRHVLREYYCYGNGIVSVDEDCGSGMVCDDGTCVED